MARGNSGAILAQFFQGLSDGVGQLRSLTLEQFVVAIHCGAQYAREALAEPREGTLITVLSDYAHELKAQFASGPAADFMPVLERGLQRAEQSLANTPNLLPVLKKAGVVDAGAEGFVDLLRGIFEFARSGSLRQVPALDPAALGEYADEAVGADVDLSHRYCTECLITGNDIDRRKLREELTALGSSLVLAGSKTRAKVHIHVNEPAAVFRLANRYGAVSGQKADDMRQQSREAARDAEHGVAIITDSGADIPDTELERLNIHMVPVRVHFGEHSYLDKVSLTPEEFYHELRNNPQHPTTSQPAPGDFRRQFQFLGSHYEAVVSINLTAKVSGTWQAALGAAERAEGAAVLVLDSHNVSAGQGLLVMYAAECAHAGMGAAEIAQAVAALRDKTRTFGALRDLTYAVRGGRVKKSKQLAADLLRLTPVLRNTPDGCIKASGVLFGKQAFVEKFARFVLRKLDLQRTWRVSVGHCNCRADGEYLLQLLRDAIPQLDNAWLQDVGSALGVHAGPGALVVGVQDYVPPGGVGP